MKSDKKVYNAFSLISMILGLAVIGLATAYVVVRYVSDKAYHAKWKDYDDCGLA